MSLPTDDFCQTYTDRDKLRDELERVCVIKGLRFEERERTILAGNVKYIFTPEGEIKTIVKGGKAFSAEGERKYVPPKGKKT